MFYSVTARNIFVTSIILVMLFMVGIFFMYRYILILKNPEEMAKREVREVVSVVGMIFDLPKDEDPIVANISNTEDIKNQPFFKNANLGDQLLIYEKNKKIILYSPVKNKIIEVSNLNMKEGESINF